MPSNLNPQAARSNSIWMIHIQGNDRRTTSWCNSINNSAIFNPDKMI
jgi:hypothetical protein